MSKNYTSPSGEVKLRYLDSNRLKHNSYKIERLGLVAKTTLKRAFNAANQTSSPLNNICLRHFTSRVDHSARTSHTIPTKDIDTGETVYLKRFNSAECVIEHKRDMQHIISACSGLPSVSKQIQRIRQCSKATSFNSDTHSVKCHRQCMSAFCTLCASEKCNKMNKDIENGLHDFRSYIKHVWRLLLEGFEVDANEDSVSDGFDTMIKGCSKVFTKSRFVSKNSSKSRKSNIIGVVYCIEAVPSKRDPLNKIWIHGHAVVVMNSYASLGDGWIKDAEWNDEFKKHVPQMKGVKIDDRNKGKSFDPEVVSRRTSYIIKPLMGNAKVRDYQIKESDKTKLGIPEHLNPSSSSIREIDKNFFKAVIPALKGRQTIFATGIFRKARKAGKALRVEEKIKEKQRRENQKQAAQKKLAETEWKQQIFTDNEGTTWQVGEIVLSQNTAEWLLHETLGEPAPIAQKKIIHIESDIDASAPPKIQSTPPPRPKPKRHSNLDSSSFHQYQLSLFDYVDHSNGSTVVLPFDTSQHNKIGDDYCYTIEKKVRL